MTTTAPPLALAPAPHPFDAAVALQPIGPHRCSGHSHPGYWNMVGPYGGITAALMLQAVLQHPDRLGEPLALTVNYAAATAEGPFEITATPVRTNRSTQHWVVTLSQPGADGMPQVGTSATVVTAIKRDTWAASDTPMPATPAAATLARADRTAAGVAWLQRYDVRPVDGDIPRQWDGATNHSRTLMWAADAPARTPCFAGLAALADVFFPRIWLKRATLVPVGTVSMTVYFHTSAAQLAENGPAHLLAQATGQEFRHGFFDHSGQLWRADGLLLATTHQIVYFKG